jgi:hypothetical protein
VFVIGYKKKNDKRISWQHREQRNDADKLHVQFPINMLLCLTVSVPFFPYARKLDFATTNAIIGMIALARLGLILQQGWHMEQPKR